MKKQVIIIHGGNAFNSYKEYIKFLKNFRIDFTRFKKSGWKQKLQHDLGRNFEVILPKMPNPTNAKYFEWRIWFRKLIPFFKKDVILVGHSMGGTFIAKYLTENKFPKAIKATFLIAAQFDEKNTDSLLVDFALPKNLANLIKQGGKIFIYQSKDDPVVLFANFYKFKQALPNAHALAFKKRGHFNQEKFPELARAIKKLL